MPKLSRWIECKDAAGKPLPVHICNGYRVRHSLNPLPVNVRAPRPDHKKKTDRPIVPPSGPGTELKRILSEFGVNERAGCGCKDFAGKMDRWGPDGCEEHMDEIVTHLKKSAAKQSFDEKRRFAWNLLKSQTWLNPLDPYKSLARLAIDAARVAAASSEANQTKEIA